MSFNHYNNQYPQTQSNQAQGFYSTNYQHPSFYQSAQQSVERTLRPANGRRVYRGGFDPGSGYAELWVAPEDDLDAVKRDIIPSWVSLGTLEEIGRRSKLLDADPVESLSSDEYVVSIDGVERYVGRLGRDEGKNRTNALNDPRRYTNEHAMSLLFALCGKLIPEDKFALRFVTALPVSLYTDENRREVQDTFTRTFPFKWNDQAKNGEFICGAVVAEGAGGLMLYGDTSSKTLVVDYGKRTTDVLIATGQKVDITRSKGFPIGVYHLMEAFNAEFVKIAKRRLDDNELEILFRAYANGEPLPEVKSSRKVVDPEKIKMILDKTYETIGDQSNTNIASIVNLDSAGEIAAEYDIVIAMGGGAYHFKKALEKLIDNIEEIRNPQSANPEGYFEIAVSFSDEVWSKVAKNVEKRKQAGVGV